MAGTHTNLIFSANGFLLTNVLSFQIVIAGSFDKFLLFYHCNCICCLHLYSVYALSTLNFKVIVIYDMITCDLIPHPKTEGLYTDKHQTVISVEIFLSFQSAIAVGINKYLQFSRLCNHHFFNFFSSLPPFILSVHAGWPDWAIFADWDTFGSSLGFLEKMK
jgi:hypothetical protein